MLRDRRPADLEPTSAQGGGLSAQCPISAIIRSALAREERGRAVGAISGITTARGRARIFGAGKDAGDRSRVRAKSRIASGSLIIL